MKFSELSYYFYYNFLDFIHTDCDSRIVRIVCGKIRCRNFRGSYGEKGRFILFIYENRKDGFKMDVTQDRIFSVTNRDSN